jgi:hypothetical protein
VKQRSGIGLATSFVSGRKSCSKRLEIGMVFQSDRAEELNMAKTTLAFVERVLVVDYI